MERTFGVGVPIEELKEEEYKKGYLM